MRGLILTLAATCFACYSCAQTYEALGNSLGLSVDYGSPNFGNGISLYDINGDGYDDLTTSTDGNGTHIYLWNNDSFELLTVLPISGDAKAVIWSDVDNDGDADLLVTQRFGFEQLWIQDNLEFTDEASDRGVPQETDADTYGAAAGDYDLDGDLDIYICNYDWGVGSHNWLLRNDGTGHFEEVSIELGVDNGVVPSFMPSWGDFNNDGWPDLYVINDKSPSNTMYLNNGDGSFSDVSESSGTDIVIDCMSNTVADYDNDGDLDIYMTNDFNGNRLLQNNGDMTFTDVTETTGTAVGRFCWGAAFFDYDCDGDQDLHVSTEDAMFNHQNIFMRQNEVGSFSESNNLFNPLSLFQAYAIATGDIDRDGFPEIAITSRTPNNVSFYKNSGANNYWIAVSLEATVSNPEAIGSWVTVTNDSGSQYKYTQAGSGYLGQNSSNCLFGFGANGSDVTIEVNWPSGWTDTVNANMNDYNAIVEGSSYEVILANQEEIFICPGDSLILDAGEYEEYLWSNGHNERYLTIYEPTNISVQVLTPYGFFANSDELTISAAPEAEILMEAQDVTCFEESDGAFLWESDQVNLILFDGSFVNSNVEGLSEGFYEMTLYDNYNCLTDTNITISSPLQLTPSFTIVEPLCFGDDNGWIEGECTGGVGEITQDPANATLNNLVAGSYLITHTDENGCEIDSLVVISEPEELVVSIDVTDATEDALGSALANVTGGTPDYTYIWSSGGDENFEENLEEGNYVLTIVDGNGCLLNTPFSIDFIVSTEQLSRNELRIYPNPTNGQIIIEGLQIGDQVDVVNASGALVLSTQPRSNQLDLSQFTTGVYLLRIVSVDKTYAFRLVIE
ncbi:FG-GAP-like repeat-containing protein [Sanyastnella coralliicola]|uniref:FG-GAP-like repeat-containing protein n=1 Tax=Sanyastnella coralliicola TaxID=3069118 RepID=UPI0027B9B375|nr:FG-GAP-like repeat-containing protein [Longitalea sp. SCSIO 12813]